MKVKRIMAWGICLLGVAGVTDAQPIEQTEASIAPAEASTTIDIDNEENRAINEMNASEPSLPATPAIQQQPANDGNHGQLAVNIILLCMAAGALALTVMVQQQVKTQGKKRDDDLNALRESIDKQNECTEDALWRMEQRIIELKQHQQTTAYKKNADYGTVPPSVIPSPRQATKPAGPKTLYLTRPDDHGFFMSASSSFERGNSIFQLSTKDGKNGTFIVIDDNEVHRLALMMPTENLTRACTGDNIQVSGGKNRIVTDKAGRASLENGRWHIAQKANIHYV